MKKFLSLLLAFAMCISLVACGSSDGGKKVYLFGETVTTDMYEFTPKFEGFAKALANTPDANFLTPNGFGLKDSDNPFRADDEKTMIYFSAVVNYIGDSKENETFDYDFTINYDTDYNFEFDLNDLRSYSAVTSEETPSFGDWEQRKIATTFEPLSSDKTRYFRFCMEVPEQLESNTDKIVVTFKVNGKKYTYKIQ